MTSKLSDICCYVKGKVDVSTLSRQTYISTENMNPNKGGICDAANLPSATQTQVFQYGDVLVSNIRPYFKKIWKAKFDGGCSNDVLVFRANDDVSKEFLYYVLADDSFFTYSMGTSKGTKMPRGDKTAIMQYAVPDFSYEKQCQIASILQSIDEKIEENSVINKNLEEQTQALFQNWFVNFEPFDGKIPANWYSGTLGQIAEIKTNSFSPGKYPDVILEHYSIPAYDEKHFPIFEIASNVKSNKYILTKTSVLISKLNPETKRLWRPLCLTNNPVCSTEFIVYEPVKTKYRGV